MKKTTLCLVLVSLISSLHTGLANAVEDDPTPLAATMKAMSPKFKALGFQIADSTKNPASIQLAQELGQLIQKALTYTPASIVAHAAAQQRAELLQFQRIMLNLALSDIDLEEALTAGNQDLAKAALAKMATDKLTGHQLFNP